MVVVVVVMVGEERRVESRMRERDGVSVVMGSGGGATKDHASNQHMRTRASNIHHTERGQSMRPRDNLTRMVGRVAMDRYHPTYEGECGCGRV